MPRKILAYLRRNAIALLALFVALGGTSYAALTINGSQIRNRSIGAVKFDPKSVAASIKARVDLQFRGINLVAVDTSSPVHVVTTDAGEDIAWTRQRFSARCVVAATAHINLNTSRHVGFNDGYVNAQFFPPDHVFLAGFGADGSRRPQAASLEMICP